MSIHIIYRRLAATVPKTFAYRVSVRIYFVSNFTTSSMSWLEWVASNAYEGGVIDSMASTRATFAKLSVFGFFANFTFLNFAQGRPLTFS